MSTPATETEVLLEWTYSPRDFFESEIEIARSDYSVDIAAGAVSARLPASRFDADADIKQRLHESLFDRMRGIQLLTRKADNPKLTRAEALRQSMLSVMGKSAPAGFSYSHPAFWAPFSLVGDGGR
jgi:hypothetical protein